MSIEADNAIKHQIETRLQNQQLPCAVAFDIAGELEATAAEVGQAANLLGVKLSKCQLGLFGYSPEKKIVTPQDLQHDVLTTALPDYLENGRLSCFRAWALAEHCKLARLDISRYCEAHGIKISNCQLGAF